MLLDKFEEALTAITKDKEKAESVSDLGRQGRHDNINNSNRIFMVLHLKRAPGAFTKANDSLN